MERRTRAGTSAWGARALFRVVRMLSRAGLRDPWRHCGVYHGCRNGTHGTRNVCAAHVDRYPAHGHDRHGRCVLRLTWCQPIERVLRTARAPCRGARLFPSALGWRAAAEAVAFQCVRAHARMSYGHLLLRGDRGYGMPLPASSECLPVWVARAARCGCFYSQCASAAYGRRAVGRAAAPRSVRAWRRGRCSLPHGRVLPAGGTSGALMPWPSHVMLAACWMPLLFASGSCGLRLARAGC